MKKRIAVTGLGVLSPIGSGTDKFWNALISGNVGTKEIHAFDTSLFSVNIGGEVTDIEPTSFIHKSHPEMLGRASHLAVAASRMAWNDAGISTSSYPSYRVGVCMGSTIGNISILENIHDMGLSEQNDVHPNYVLNYSLASIAGSVSAELGLEGPSLTISTACASGNNAISRGMDLIQQGMADAVVVGGADCMSRTCYTVFYRLGAIAPEASRPFTKDRKGMIVSEGAGSLVLEDMEKAMERGARIYAELAGYGLSCDAYHLTAPHPEGMGAVLAMDRAMQDANVAKKDISYISAHGTGTKANDSSESKAIYSIFGEQTDSIPISSIKSMLGHTMGAASAIEAVACTLAIYHSVIPPTMNVTELDPECVKNVVPNRAVYQPVNVAMSNSFAFGGNISTIILKGVNHDPQ
ncbi:MAG: beta-ketoacyl-[acyl-carrier-protein] synthase family protein [Paenibacillus dendritiformis]|uniref:beta-ketoacyl-[acyl-carrier-protein] synthase family protein n=1 Tax=Paenibacillus dendritiformis TaxID=130049 RepID=UPI00143D2791|nr:beta-ketoacyl-[acyl-carrier-protein] synthase family protein [Paenibacillus dendritiformis]MDU5145890.1 beta-ketoacyl-[acyl-carrier-protein] synthase family protein [Paenibacillus dendritiformis]NKI21923.1 beta-ketoacyl-[acyl-carrier-protein] synthase family protein [Paenibacillus dendritiformis]NRF97453.1 beta-ketoacyl-[acyl-carrier-protein] synthase family protein [Paenibacillus dendritiformis]GIO71159.1 beta-ketoacyl-[acyl-carrier-protein] synthase II [Paenibacillus dendritiformis]